MKFAAGEPIAGYMRKDNLLKMSNRLGAIAGIAATLSVAVLPAAAGAKTLFGSGSSAEQPILNPLFREYAKLNRKIRFVYSPDGGNQGVKDVQARRSEFAINTRPPLPSDHSTTYIKLYLDGLCVVVNPANQISNITLGDAKNVFLGLDTNWNQVAGSNLSTTIDPYGRNSTAGSYTFFQQAVLGNKTQSSNVVQETSDGLVATAVSKDTGGIGYVGLAHTGPGSGVKTLTVDRVSCSQSTIRNNSYPLWRWIWAVIPTPGSGARLDPDVERFINWVATSKIAGQLIGRAGAVPAFNKR
ncbi:MAG: substrate-binding domain-containing protein [Acetobacteraceae bacterium]|nr:substrate-binding domain-containing protein [Acetobacteraceae bacterium]